MKNNNAHKIIWRDFQIFRFFMITICVVFIIMFSYGVYTDNSWTGYSWIWGVLLILFFVFFLLLLLLPVSTYISTEGIRIGNIPKGTFEYNLFKLRYADRFLSWKEIKSIEIVNRVDYRVLNSYLIIHTFNKKKLETFIAHPEAFRTALNSLGKYNLMQDYKTHKICDKNSAIATDILGSEEVLKEELSLKYIIGFCAIVGAGIAYITASSGIKLWNRGILFPIAQGIIDGVIGFIVLFGAIMLGRYFSRMKMTDKSKKIFVIILFIVIILMFITPYIMVHVFHLK